MGVSSNLKTVYENKDIDKDKAYLQSTWWNRDAQDLRTDGVVENIVEWWSVDQRTSEVKKAMKANEEREVRAAKRSLGALRGESRARVTARAARSQARERTEEAIAEAQARGDMISPAKSDIFSPL